MAYSFVLQYANWHTFTYRSHRQHDQESNQCKNPIRPVVDWLHCFADWRSHDVFGTIELRIHIDFNTTRRHRSDFIGASLSTYARFQHRNNNDSASRCPGRFSRHVSRHSPDLTLPSFLQHHGNSIVFSHSVHPFSDSDGQVSWQRDSQVPLVCHSLLSRHVLLPAGDCARTLSCRDSCTTWSRDPYLGLASSHRSHQDPSK